MFITAALIFSVLVLVSEKSSMTRFAPVSMQIHRHHDLPLTKKLFCQIGIGLTYFACHL
jgi:hypothetical protein